MKGVFAALVVLAVTASLGFERDDARATEPAKAVTLVGNRTVEEGTPIGFGAHADGEPGETLLYSWDFGDGHAIASTAEASGGASIRAG